MQENFETPETPEPKSKISPVTLGMGVVVAAAILLSFWFLFQAQPSQNALTAQGSVSLRMNPAEQEYAKKIEIGKIEMSRAENFLHQEVTTLAGELYNAGPQPVLSLTLTTEFSDDMSQIVLRESRNVLKNGSSALAPGERRNFEISFERIPNSWNMQYPAIHISQLQLATQKQ
jgi:hypothetical protein